LVSGPTSKQKTKENQKKATILTRLRHQLFLATMYKDIFFQKIIYAKTVRYLYQQIKLVPLKVEKPLLSIWRIKFSKGNEICDLTKSESFYLLTEIFEGKETNHKFENKYQIQFWNNEAKKETIYTDGRFFKLKDKIIDIGYNFLIVNNLTDQFRQKNKYD
jgi:hypothetical protein